VFALVAALLLFGLFVWLGGTSPVETWVLLFKGAFGDWYSWQNTLVRAAPLMLDRAVRGAAGTRRARRHRR
jgi:simple sugar transport system permease protein